MAKYKVDFTGVETFVKCDEGDHIVRIKEIDEEPNNNGNDQLTVTFEVIKGSSTGATVRENFVLVKQSYWKLKQLLAAAGLKNDGRTVVDTTKLVGKTLMITVVHREYNGNTYANANEFRKIPPKAAPKAEEDYEADDEDWEDDEEEEAPAPKKKSKPASKKKPKKKPKPEPEEEDWEEDEDDWEEE